MLNKTRNVVLIQESFESTRNPLILKISEENVKELGMSSYDDSNKQNFFGVLLYHHKQVKGLFVTLTASRNHNEKSATFSHSNTTALYATMSFLQHYNLSIEMPYTFSIINPVPLDKVIFGARTAEAFSWAKSENWNRELLSLLSEEMILCRTGDVPLFRFDENNILISHLLTLECSPVCQGLITMKTSVLIVKLFPEISSDNVLDKMDKEKTDSSSIDSYLNLMNYTSRLLMSNQLPSEINFHNKNVIPVIKSLATSNTALRMFCNSKPLKIEIMPKLNPELNLEMGKVDLHNTIFINPSEFPSQLGLNQSHNWTFVKLKADDNGSTCRTTRSLSSSNLNPATRNESVKRAFSSNQIDDNDDDSGSWRLVKVHPTLAVLPNRTAQITPQLWFNINAHPSLLLQPHSRLIFKPALCEHIPEFADEVYLALVMSPSYSTSQNFDMLLKTYFETTRYLKVGDIIALALEETVMSHETMPDFANTERSCRPTIYFHVSRIEPPQGSSVQSEDCGFNVDTKHSKLYQSGNKESYAPITMETFHSKAPFHRIFDTPCLPGSIGRVTENICSIICPFLKSQRVRKRVGINILLSGVTGSGKFLAIKAACRNLNLHLHSVDCQEIVGEAAGATETRLKNCASKALQYAPAVFHLRNISHFSREKKETSASNNEDPRTIGNFGQILNTLSGPASETNWPLIVIATTCNAGMSESSKGDGLHPDLASLFLHHILIGTPNEEDRASILEGLLPLELPQSISINRLAQKTAGFVLSDLAELVSNSTYNAFQRVSEKMTKNHPEIEENEIILAGIAIQQKDFDQALEKLQSSQAESIGAPKIPNVRWDDVGGLEMVKKEILNTIQLPLNHPELVQSGLRRSGVLLHGPPGTGKTLLAKAVATECSLNFLSVKGPELINMYVGQSEENVREVFLRARNASPCVIFFDELDSLAPNRGLSGDSGGVMDRVVSQLLAELDGLNQAGTNIFVIGATNRPDLLDPALLRPGRFDRLVELGVAETSKERLHILGALTRKMPLSNNVILEEIEKLCPEGLTGADFYSLCSDAQNKALERCIKMLEAGLAQEENIKPEITAQDFVLSISSLEPSV